MGKYSKVIAAVVGVIVTFASTHGLDFEPYVGATTSILTVAAVYFFANE